MSEAVRKLPGPSGHDDGIAQTAETADANGLKTEIEQFSQLSSDLKRCLSDMARRIQSSTDEFNAVQKVILRKKAELKEIYDIEASASALQKLIEEHRNQKEEFERYMENQNRLWAEEKALKEQEDAESREARYLRRQREEEEYKRRWAEERLTIRQKLEEELCAIQQRSIEKQKTIENDLHRREQALKEKELEWVKLIRELELFMTRLVARTRKDDTGLHMSPAEMKNAAIPINRGGEEGISVSSETTLGGEEMPGISEELGEDPDPSVASIREMLLSQGRRIENIHSNFTGNQDPVPFRVFPKKNL